MFVLSRRGVEMKKLVLATGNLHKVEELKEMLQDCVWEIDSLASFPEFVMPEETGDSFAANALIKARAVAEYTNCVALADDSGLEVDILDGRPGVYSARFAGLQKSDRANNTLLLQLLSDVSQEQRSAHFKASIAIAIPQGTHFICEGVCPGIIATESVGDGGFGYDCLLFLPEYQKTVAQLTLAEKNKISHRAKAVEQAIPILKKIFSV